MFKVAICVAFFLAYACAANTASVGIPITTAVTQFCVLSEGQVTTPTGSSAVGAAIFNYDSTAALLSWEIIHTVTGVTAAHIHGPAYIGSDGSPIITFANTNSPMVGNASFTAANAVFLTAGKLYVNIHTTAFPGGEIRGQIMNSGQQTVDFFETPAGVTSYAHAFVSFNAATKTLTYNVSHTVADANALHIHGPANTSNTASPIVILANDSTSATSPVIGSQVVSASEALYFSSELNYINIHSVTYPNGVLRGNILMPSVQFAIPLDGVQEGGVTTANLGIAIVSVASDGNTADVFVISTIPDIDVTGLHIHGPAAYGSTANPLVVLHPNAVSGNPYSIVNTTIVGWMNSGLAYINVHSSANPNGEIRGQFTPLGTGLSGSTTTATATTTAKHSSACIVSASALISAVFAAVALF